MVGGSVFEDGILHDHVGGQGANHAAVGIAVGRGAVLKVAALHLKQTGGRNALVVVRVDIDGAAVAARFDGLAPVELAVRDIDLPRVRLDRAAGADRRAVAEAAVSDVGFRSARKTVRELL